MSVREGVPIGEIERRELNGQILQGTSTAREVWGFLSTRGLEAEFPLLTAVHREFYCVAEDFVGRKADGSTR